MMKVILISGKARHGKDTTARYLKETLEESGFSVLITHYGDLVKYICRSFFRWDGVKDASGRTLLQYVGTDVIRKQDENYWVRFIGNILTFFYGRWDYVLIPDCRFPNEVEYLKQMGFDTFHVRVIRNNFESPLSSRQQEHPSETALDNVQAEYVVNNDGGINDLREKAIDLASEILRRRGYCK